MNFLEDHLKLIQGLDLKEDSEDTRIIKSGWKKIKNGKCPLFFARSITLSADRSELSQKAVLVRTGWDKRWGTESYWEPGPYLSKESIDLLISSKTELVGVDFWNADDTADLSRPVHTRLLASNILVVEHLCNLSALPRTGFTFYAVPLRIVHGASFPVRAFAEIVE